MPRTALGPSAKSVIISARLTKTEKDILLSKVGNISHWIRKMAHEKIYEDKK